MEKQIGPDLCMMLGKNPNQCFSTHNLMLLIKNGLKDTAQG
ncbi:Uncharacterised protein [Vibrio cholerae]|nr:hypothetical protein VIJ_002252 [Vibrio cholerae RC27]CSA95026.1 Uncharacterised protein [Vibrio cholerae]CSB01750.1 Uncharacterised protein [Vibrio cholerae]CSD08459.1 Uncharacterised protein [Vibrio cholerae]